MEQIKKDTLLLELIEKPVLCVQDGIIVDMNDAAARLQIPVQIPVTEFISGNVEDYRSFASGQLSLTLTIAGLPCEATVVRTEDTDLFILDQPENFEKLQAIALAAQQLRVPLNDVMTLTDQLLSSRDLEAECALRTQAQKINKGFFRLLRIISNMADAQRYASRDSVRMETLNLTSFCYEIFEKASALIQGTGITLKYTGLPQPVFGLASSEYLERGIYNLISNAVKFSPKGGTVEAKLTQTDNTLCLSICNQGERIPEHIYGNLFARYARQPGIEDGRHGIGLGMALIRTAAAVHGGTVLIDQPEKGGTRVCFTIALRQNDTGEIRSTILPLYDYAGGWDHGLVELSEALSYEAYHQ